MSQWWWEQAGIDLKGAKKWAAEATVSDSESKSESDMKSNEDLGGEEESKGAIGSSRVEWSGADK